VTFQDKMKHLREAAGLTQEGLAVRAGVSVGVIRRYEQRSRKPAFDIVVKIARALGQTCEAFADCEDITDGRPKGATPKRKGNK